MLINRLKPLRVVLSLAIFGFILTFFLDIKSKIPTSYFHPLLSLQFIPSIIKAFVSFSIGFLLVIVLSLLIGRIYCSSICPMGTLQDILIFITSRFKKKSKNRYKKPRSYLRYGLFMAILISFLFMGQYLTGIADPYSNFGRISVQLFRPIAIILNNLLSALLENFEIYSFYPVNPVSIILSSFVIALISLISIILLSVFRNRLFCNTLCPVGTILGTLSGFALYRKEIDRDKCSSCRNCENRCKSNCIDSSQKSIDSTRCISCFNCINSCSKGAISYKMMTKPQFPSFNSASKGDSKNPHK